MRAQAFLDEQRKAVAVVGGNTSPRKPSAALPSAPTSEEASQYISWIGRNADPLAALPDRGGSRDGGRSLLDLGVAVSSFVVVTSIAYAVSVAIRRLSTPKGED